MIPKYLPESDNWQDRHISPAMINVNNVDMTLVYTFTIYNLSANTNLLIPLIMLIDLTI